MKEIRYTVRSVPSAVDWALRLRARRQRKSLNKVVLDLLVAGVNPQTQDAHHDDLDQLIGTWKEDAAFAVQHSMDCGRWT